MKTNEEKNIFEKIQEIIDDANLNVAFTMGNLNGCIQKLNGFWNEINQFEKNIDKLKDQLDLLQEVVVVLQRLGDRLGSLTGGLCKSNDFKPGGIVIDASKVPGPKESLGARIETARDEALDRLTEAVKAKLVDLGYSENSINILIEAKRSKQCKKN